MCGIVGYTGQQEAEPILIEGLRRLEYRGYDSAGVAILKGGRLAVRKRAGRISNLASYLEDHPAPGATGIGHTRWATHGAPSDRNAHPHVGGAGKVVVVHNGVIENYAVLKRELQQLGYVFHSDTDTEVIAHLIAHHLEDDLAEAVAAILPRLKGTYGLAVISPLQPGVLIGARLGSPLVLGIADGEAFLASDPTALAGIASKVVYLADNQVCVLKPDDWHVLNGNRVRVATILHTLDTKVTDLDPGEYDHFMLKEIHEQPEAVENAMRGRLDKADGSARFGGLNLDTQRLRQMDRIILTACGTSYHAALVGEYLFEELARIPVEVEYASEFRYRNPPMDRNTVVIALTQSGETADTLAAVRESKRKGHPTLALCNVVGSSIAREADGGVYLHAGPEIGVASTKAFTNQVAVLTMLALYFGRMRHLSFLQGNRIIDELHTIPDMIRKTLTCADQVRQIAEKYAGATNCLYLGRQFLFPVALEGALKLKEISYIHAEGYPAAEMKHGPIALVDEETPTIFLIQRGGVYDKVVSNLEEIKARGGPVIAIATEGDEEIAGRADDVVFIPEVPEYLQPLVAVVPLQLLAYHIALLRGCDVDKPRNLAKSVTVEQGLQGIKQHRNPDGAETMPVIIYEDAAVANLEPLALTRPAFDLRCGAATLLERQLRFFGAREAGALVRPALVELCRRAHPELAVNQAVAGADGPLTLVNARWLPLNAERPRPIPEVGLVGEEVAYVRLSGNEYPSDGVGLEAFLAESNQNLPQRQVGGRLMNYPWDLVESNPDALREDALIWQQDHNFRPHPAAAVVGPAAEFLCHPSARVEPHVLVDTTSGPVLVDRDAVVHAFSRLEGPCYVGPETQVFAARIRTGSIGPQCRVGGEFEASIVQGYSNKYHDGFLGHSYLGEWVNFGAGTHTSDLRNDYGAIAMPINGRTVQTGLTKIGAYIGDHTRTSIATLLNTGTVIGPFGMLIASGSLLPRLIPAFTSYGYGRIQERTDLGQMFATAAIAMARRGQEWTPAHVEFYLGLFDETAESRRLIIRDSDQRRLRRVVG